MIPGSDRMAHWAPVTPQTLLGPRLRRYRSSLSALAILGWLAAGPLITVITVLLVGIADVRGVLLAVLGGMVVLAVAVAYLLWSGSAHLDLHEHGVVVGRSFLGGAPRAMQFTEIDPLTIRVVAGADTLLPIWQVRIRRPSSGQLFLFPRADRAVTFLGPDQDSALSGVQRPVAPGNGIVVFGSQQAEEIAHQLRTGLERAGCPPHLARWSAGLGVHELPGNGSEAARQVPGMLPERLGGTAG